MDSHISSVSLHFSWKEGSRFISKLIEGRVHNTTQHTVWPNLDSFIELQSCEDYLVSVSVLVSWRARTWGHWVRLNFCCEYFETGSAAFLGKDSSCTTANPLARMNSHCFIYWYIFFLLYGQQILSGQLFLNGVMQLQSFCPCSVELHGKFWFMSECSSMICSETFQSRS